MDIVVSLPDNVFRSVTKLAERANKPVGEVISQKIETDFEVSNVDNQAVISQWSDADVLELAMLRLSAAQDGRLSELLEKQREREISPSERVELEGLMESYNVANLRKSQGIVEAVKRGLISFPADLNE